MGFDIFLSYSRADQAVADAFFQAASKRGLSLWYDQLLQGGEDWREGIVHALSSSKALVILFSETSNSSVQLIKELAVADSIGKPVIPVLIEKTEPRGAYLYEMAARNWIRLYPDPLRKMDTLIPAIESQLQIGGAAASSPSPRATPVPVAPPAEPDAPGWLPVKRYDAIFLAILAADAVAHTGGFHAGAGVNIILILAYMIVLAVRNARLNRGVFSHKSFLSYVAAGLLIIPFALLPDKLAGATDANASVAFGVILLSIVAGIFANILQVILRPIFQRARFRARVASASPAI